MYELIAQRVQHTEQENARLLEKLKSVAQAIQESGMEQPSQCLFEPGVCGYPIDDCFNCPCHEWAPSGMPFTKCDLI